MTAVAFDTLKFANRLKKAGISPEHAEAEAEALSEVFETNLNELATKGDIDAKLADVKFEILKWVVGLALAQIGLLVGILVKFT
jgi:hypothetical protein